MSIVEARENGFCYGKGEYYGVVGNINQLMCFY